MGENLSMDIKAVEAVEAYDIYIALAEKAWKEWGGGSDDYEEWAEWYSKYRNADVIAMAWDECIKASDTYLALKRKRVKNEIKS